MKLFGFVRRARRAPATSAPVPSAAAQEDATGPPSEKRRRGSASWKPTLVAISEDADAVTAVAVAQAQAKPAAAARKAKARPSSSSRAARSSFDEFRYSGPPTMLPAFTPTAFLF